MKKLLDNAQAADYLGVAETTLTTWRCRQTYPITYTKIGGKVRYDLDDLNSFIESRKVRPEVQ